MFTKEAVQIPFFKSITWSSNDDSLRLYLETNKPIMEIKHIYNLSENSNSNSTSMV